MKKMLISATFVIAITFSTVITPFLGKAHAKEECHELLNFSATKLRSDAQINFCEAFSGKALLVVNTASQCGFTPRFKGLEALHKKYGDKLAVVGFPSDDFNQEYDDSEKVADVCYVNYGVSFTMLEPSSVKGESANSVFKNLAAKTGQEPAWNFTKYLVSADGKTVKHFASSTKPQSDKFTQEIETILN